MKLKIKCGICKKISLGEVPYDISGDSICGNCDSYCSLEIVEIVE